MSAAVVSGRRRWCSRRADADAGAEGDAAAHELRVAGAGLIEAGAGSLNVAAAVALARGRYPRRSRRPLLRTKALPVRVFRTDLLAPTPSTLSAHTSWCGVIAKYSSGEMPYRSRS